MFLDKCFENNLIFIDDDYKVVISELRKKLYEQLKINTRVKKSFYTQEQE